MTCDFSTDGRLRVFPKPTTGFEASDGCGLVFVSKGHGKEATEMVALWLGGRFYFR